ncbi:MAG: cysteine methyltransferase, partial [Gammaproteobacteria bacterium]|nr:cysteine methyltransferase [Gammaproteobacteria bacterium]
GHIAFPIESESFQEQRAKLISEGVSVKGSRVSLKEFQWQPELMDILFALDN